jgi:hypothetical protein
MEGTAMFVFRRWLGNLKSRSNHLIGSGTEKDVIYAPGTKITYDRTLVPRLKQDHAQLLKIFTLMLNDAKAANYQKLKLHLGAFQKLFNAHALSEYTKLYIFLDYAFKQDEANNELIREFKREMNEIGRAVRAFYVNWIEADISDRNVKDFLTQAEGMGKVLVRRIKTEEERLYEIYDMAPSMFAATSINH